MPDYRNILIAIQARSTSQRFPRKVFAPIGGIPMLTHVLQQAKRCANYLNNNTEQHRMKIDYALLVPYEDEIVTSYRSQVPHIIEGPEQDVLARYHRASQEMSPDYIVRITADCPLIQPHLITRHIKTSVMKSYDYCSNVDPRLRTAPDGMDCEVISRRMLDYTFQHAKESLDREHVTTFMRNHPPSWARRGVMVGFLPFGHLKLSVDTPEDLERVREVYSKVREMVENAEQIYGVGHVHRL